ncbi:RHS repeat domain-containing protein [Streptomyces sp. NPDC058001]|uniref:RHS repeat domain-containing protein n=1 Tax=Streptomyces sp. NPDC058001 TaxID=3346300 RepID=UPI0036ED738A
MRCIAASLAAYLLLGLLGGPVAAAAELGLRTLKKPDPVPTSAAKAQKINRPDQTAEHAWRPTAEADWPTPATGTIAVPQDGEATATVGSLPVRLAQTGAKRGHADAQKRQTTGPAQAQIQVLDQRTADSVGVEGILLAVRPLTGSKGTLDVTVDYARFRHAFGGDWASRLTLRQLPVCALTSPDQQDCRQGRTLATDNDTRAATLSAPVTLPEPQNPAASALSADTPPVTRTANGSAAATGGTVLLAVTAAASGAAGDFGATSLSPSSSWSAGGSNGGFSWNYGLTTPDVPGGVQPDLKLAYNSQAVDGRTAATNNQANWIGDGWSMEPGYIERRYVSCSDDAKDGNGTDKSGDLCWKNDNAVISLGGQTSVLVKDDSAKDDPQGEWRMESDDGTKAVKLTGTDRGNGDNDGEYWRVTTPDGTQYYFGYNRLPGWTDGKPETNSTWTVPVFGNHKDEPCHATAFKDSWCQQAWRWNLDYVVDPHSDAMAYYWNKETNYYGRNVNPDTGASTATAYTRGGYLDRIEYGLRSDTMYGQKAAGKVDFTVSERCLTDCGTFDKANAKSWPDVPFDRYCASGDECKDRYSPSFWTRKRLTKIDTSVLTGGVYKPVDTWTLTHQFPTTGDGTDPALWLASLTRTGHTGTGDVTMPAVTFRGQQLANRVEGATTGGRPDPVPPLVRYRIYGIDTETGSTLGVTYSSPDCKAGDVPTPASNTRRCYPVIWSPPDAPAADYEPYLDWFHTYVVTQILEADNTGGAPVKQTDYSYLGGMAWAKEEDEFSQAKYLTYGDRRGYGRVQVRTGAPASDKQTLKEYRYFRGIDGATVADHEGTAVTDHPAFAGMTREEATFNGDGGKLEATTSYEPWRSAANATRTRPGLSAQHAYATGGKSEKTRTAVGSGWRSTQIDRTHDAYGLVLTESDLGDTAKTGDEECTTTTYNRNTDANMLTLIKEIKQTAIACDKTPTLPADLISVERHYYDNAASRDTPPTKGDVSRLEEQDDKGTGFVTAATHTYDQHGRELTNKDAVNNTTTTQYTPRTIEAPTTVTVTNALGHATTTQYDPLRGVATAAIDPNDKRTDATYDGLGRVLKVWNPGWAKADHATQPSTEFTYSISKTQANAVATKMLQYDGSYTTAYQLYDGLLRERETQAPAVGTTNRIVTEIHYDTRGFAWKSYAAYYTNGAPSKALDTAPDNKVPTATENLYDGLGRITDAISRAYGDEKWRTTTQYAGDRTTVIPPKGGTATTVVTDARGRTTERLQYTNAARTASQKTAYGYGKWDEPETVTDPAGNIWRYTFDARGQKMTSVDPDKGTSHTTYDRVGRPVTATDARNITLTTKYDELGRQTELTKGTALLAKWTYDTVAKGQPASSIRYLDGAAYTSAVDSYNDTYQPTSQTVTIPAATGTLAGTYTWTYGYNTYTSQQEWIRHPAVGNLPTERQTTVYAEGNLPLKTTVGSITLVNSTAYDVFSRPTRTEYGTLGKKVYKTQLYDDHTGRLNRQTTDRDLAPQRIDDTAYDYAPAGNITGITTTSGQDTTKSIDRQCFTEDALGRLTEAWTTVNNDCTTQPSATTVGGPDAYWQSFAYDAAGNRTQQTDHKTGALTGADATTTYTQRDPNTGLPHAVQETSTKGGPDDGKKTGFTYDEAGNTLTRTTGTQTQKLDWDDEGHLASLTEAGKTTRYQYDADGNRMITRDADGSQTLTLPGGNELKTTATGTKEGVRYYTHGQETVAVRTGTGFSFLLPDHQGTSMAAIAMTTLAITRRKQLPFGQTRSALTETIPGTRGFVGGTTDPTGLTHLGAREYDPQLGRFLSVDPIIDHNDPAQLNAYSYAHNNPITKSDPTGLRPDGPAGGAGYNDDRWASDRGMTAGYTKKNGKWVWQQTPLKDKSSKKKYTAYRANPSSYKVYHYDAKKAAQAQANAKAQADARAKAQAIAREKAEAERRKKNGIFGSIMGGLKKSWDNTGGKVGGFVTEHWRGITQIGIIVVGTIAVGVCTAATAGLCAGAGGIIISGAIGVAQGVATYGVSGGKHTAMGYVQAGAIGGFSAGGAAGVGKVSMLMGGTRISPSTAPYHSVSTMTSSAVHNGGRFWEGGVNGRQVINHLGFGTKWAD